MSNPLASVLDLDNSESVAAGTAAVMLGGPAASDQVGQALTTITGLIGLNPEVAGGISALYAIFRLFKKWRSGRKAGGKAPKVVAAVMMLALLPAAAWADDGRAIAVGAAVVDAEGAEDEGTGYSAAWLEPLGDSGRYSGHVRLQRLTDLGELDAYNVDLDMLANFGVGKRFQGFLGGGLGSVFEDATERTETVEVPPVAGLHGQPNPQPQPQASTLVVNLEDSDAYVRWSAVGGFRVYLDAEHRYGLSLEYRRSDGLQDSGDDRAQDGLALSFLVPTEAAR